jgi:hypothetical protein
MSSFQNTAVVLGSTKNALLYFDNIVPINMLIDLLPREYDDPDELIESGSGHQEVIRHRKMPPLEAFTPPILWTSEKSRRDFVRVNECFMYFSFKIMITEWGFPNKINGVSAQAYENIERKAVKELYRFLNSHGLQNATFDCGGAFFSSPQGNNSESLVSLPALHLVDAESASWDHIMEFRSDAEAQARLRRLRVFMLDNYEGKSLSYVEDDILSRIDAYETEAKRWGFETCRAALSTVMSSKVLGGSIASSLFSALGGGPTLATLAAGGVGALEIGRLTLEISKFQTALSDESRQNPISFISYARDKIDAEKTSGGRRR